MKVSLYFSTEFLQPSTLVEYSMGLQKLTCTNLTYTTRLLKVTRNIITYANQMFTVWADPTSYQIDLGEWNVNMPLEQTKYRNALQQKINKNLPYEYSTNKKKVTKQFLSTYTCISNASVYIVQPKKSVISDGRTCIIQYKIANNKTSICLSQRAFK